MTFAGFHRVIKENDTVILYIGIEEMHALEVKKTIRNKHGTEVPNTFQTRYGALQVMSLVGREFGSRVQLTKGWAVVLYPTPELWTLTLPHRTQILYTTDISMVLGRLNVGPGSVVCEAGTGSGSLSHAFLRAVGPTGRLHTADFHKERGDVARAEFARHGLEGRVTVSVRDVCADGWDVEGLADAVFLDMPRPWGALHHAVNSIKATGGRICSFSPCIEQVSRTSAAMRRLGLQSIRTIEVLTRELQVKQIDLLIINIQQEERSKKKVFNSENGSENSDTPACKKTKLDTDAESPQDNVSEPDTKSVTAECELVTKSETAESGGLVTKSETVESGGLVTKSETAESGGLVTKSETAKSGGLVTKSETAESGGLVTKSETADSGGLVTKSETAECELDINTKMEVDTHVEENPTPKTPVDAAPSAALAKAPPSSVSFLSTMPLKKQAGHTGFLTFCVVPPGVPRPTKSVQID